MVNDSQIINLYWKRDEQAIVQTKAKYDGYCRHIAYNILNDYRDVEECMADTYLAAWNSIPPQKPALLSAYIAKITRNISLKRFRNRRALKRGGGEIALALDELAQCVPDKCDLETALGEAELSRIINRFLAEQSREVRGVFLRRYWYLESIAEIAAHFGFSQSKVKSILFRTREKLWKKLKKEGVFE